MREYKDLELILSSSLPFSKEAKDELNEMYDLLTRKKIKIDLFKLYKNVTFKNESNEFYFIETMTKYIDSYCGDFALGQIRSLIIDFSQKNKLKQIMEFISSHMKIFFHDKRTIELNYTSIFSQIKFYIILLLNQTKLNRNCKKVVELTKLCLEKIIELLKYSIETKQSARFIELLQNILTPQFKLFQILLSQYNSKVYEQFVTNLVNELIENNYTFVLKQKETDNLSIFYLFTKLFVEFFSEKISIDFSLNLFNQFLNNLMITFDGNINILKFLKNYLYFENYLKTFNNFEQFFKLSTQIFDKNELTYDFLVTICEIINRIENSGLISRGKVNNLSDFAKLFDFLSTYLVSANIEKTFCSHCTNIKRHSIINYGIFYINYYRNLCKNDFKFCTKENLAKSVNIIKYNFSIWASLPCSTATHLFDVLYTLNYNFAVTLSSTTDPKLNETSFVVSKILLKYIKHNQNSSINIDVILLSMLRGLKICESNKYLELYCFFVILQMQKQDLDRTTLISHVQRIVQQFWTDESIDNNPSFLKVLESIGDILYEIPKPKYDKIDVLILVLETVGNYRFRTNIRMICLQELFRYADCSNYIKVGEFLSTYKFIDQTFIDDLIKLYDNLINLTKNCLLLGLLKHKIFVVKSDKMSETKKSIVYDIDFEKNVGMFDNEKLSSETTLLQDLIDSLDYLTKFILKNFNSIKNLKYENLIEILYSIGQNLYFRDYKIEATQAFGLLLGISLELNYEIGIIEGFNYFFNNYKLYGMYINYNKASYEILKLPPSLDDIVEINNNIIKKQEKSDDDRVLINYLNYSKYLLDLDRKEEFFKTIKIFIKSYMTESLSLTSEIKYYHLKLLLLIIYYKINNDKKNSSFALFKYILQFFICYKNLKYSNLLERFETYNLLFDSMEYFSDFVISKRLFYEKDFYLITIIRFALKVSAIKRLLSFLRFSIKLDIFMETFGQISFKLACFNRIVEKKCNQSDNIKTDGNILNLKNKKPIKTVEPCKNSTRNDVSKLPYIYNECTIRRNYNIHVDEIESIAPFELIDFDFEPVKLHKANCKCFMCVSDLKISFFYLDVCLLIGRLQYYRKQNFEAKEIFQNGLNHLNYMKTKYKDTFKFTINLEYYKLMKMNAYECLAHLHMVDKDYVNAKKILLKAKNNYKLTNSRLPIGYFQNILIQLKFINEALVDGTFILSTLIEPSSYDVCQSHVIDENLNICSTNLEPVTEIKKKRTPKLKCISIKKSAISSFDSSNSENENKRMLNKIKLYFPKELHQDVIEIPDSPVKKTVLTSKTSNVVETNGGVKISVKNTIVKSSPKRILRKRTAKR